MEDSCILPCKGIYADVVNNGAEDLHLLDHFKPVLDKYKEYKSGFVIDQGEHFFLLIKATNHTFSV